MATKAASSRSRNSAPEAQSEMMPPETFNRILSGLELLDIRLEKMSASQDADVPVGTPVKLEVKVESALLPDEHLDASTTLTVKGVRGRKAILTISATYRVRFTSRERVGEDFFEIFREINLPLHVWPFFRELVHTSTARMGLPPLTLPLVKTGLPPVPVRQTQAEKPVRPAAASKRAKLAN